MSMLIAIPIWEGRVSPVFDVAQHVALATTEAGKVISTTEKALPVQDLSGRAKLLAEWKVDVLLCGALSGCVLHLLEESGIRVVPYVCGPVEQVLATFMENRLAERGLIMPGCRCVDGGGPRRRRRRRCRNRQGDLE